MCVYVRRMRRGGWWNDDGGGPTERSKVGGVVMCIQKPAETRGKGLFVSNERWKFLWTDDNNIWEDLFIFCFILVE